MTTPPAGPSAVGLGKATTETDSRIVIDRMLRDAGWNIEDKTQVTTSEELTDGQADYLLLDSRGRPLAVIEAKRFKKDAYSAKGQTESYARSLNAPFVFLSNGDTTYFWDYQEADARQVDSFFTRIDLERRAALKKQRRTLSTVPIPERIYFHGEELSVRPYQRNCLKAIDKAIESKRRKLLIEMATGTGKTLTIALQIKRLFQAGVVQRVLFLCDRIELAKQAKEDTFDDCLSEYPSVLLTGGKRSKEGQIVVGTLPTIQGQIGPGGFSSGYFDLVITDECHRSIYSKYRDLLTHFDAIHIGLTATPNPGKYEYVNDLERRLIRNTYLFFDCWNPLTETGEPTFCYGMLDGIRDGYLADYDIYIAKTRITTQGINWEGEDYRPTDLERYITVEDRNKLMVKEFVAVEKARGGEHPRKTIVFAVTKKHADQLTRFFNAEYPEFAGRYAEAITTDTVDPERRAIRRFKKEPFPVIAVSVGMLDTGFDCPEVENLIMMRPTQSVIFYQQMRGRGSRRCGRIGKTSFLVYDFVGNAERFNDPKYDPNQPTPGRIPNVSIPGAESDQSKRHSGFTVVPEGSVTDEFVEKKWIEVGPEGLRIDAKTYQEKFINRVSKLAKTDPVLRRIQSGNNEVTDGEVEKLLQAIGGPEEYFNETNLRDAYEQPVAGLLDFIKHAFGRLRFPTKEERLSKAFDGWLIQKNFDPERTRILRVAKNQYLAGRELSPALFNEKPLSELGGLRRASQLFGEQQLQQLLRELQEDVLSS